MVTLVVDIYEPTHDYPIVVHKFQGDTRAEAEHYYRSHLKSDAFLRGCVRRGRFKRVTCTHRKYWE